MRADEKTMNRQPTEKRRDGLIAGAMVIVLVCVLGIAVPATHGAPQQGTLPWKPVKGMEDSYAGKEMYLLLNSSLYYLEPTYHSDWEYVTI